MEQVRPHLQGRPCLVVRPCLAHVARWLQLFPKCVPSYENHNTTRGILLVLKMCMKLVVYASRTWGFDGRIFVVRTVNKLPQDERLLVLEQSLDLASVDQGLHGVITRQVPAHKLHALLANLKRLVWEKFSFTLPMGLLSFHLASEIEKYYGFWLCISHSSSFLDPISEFFLKILQRKTRFLGWFPRLLKWYLLPHQRL
jgi:hypothetical protein